MLCVTVDRILERSLLVSFQSAALRQEGTSSHGASFRGRYLQLATSIAQAQTKWPEQICCTETKKEVMH